MASDFVFLWDSLKCGVSLHVFLHLHCSLGLFLDLIYVLSYSDLFGFVLSYILLLTLRCLFSKES